MTVAIVLLNADDEGPMAAFLARHGLSPQICWRMKGERATAETLLPALEAAYASATPAPEMVLFPPSSAGDELATRLAWRLHGSAVCQIQKLDAEAQTVAKAVYGNAMLATLRPERLPVCLSLAGNLPLERVPLPASLPVTEIVPVPDSCGLPAPVTLTKSAHPLQSARVILATGQGAAEPVFDEIAAALRAEAGYTRQRVMAGGCDEQRMLGISGQSVAPGVCLIAGASGASAFMAGVARSEFIVAINRDPSAAVFAAADVGIVGDAQAVLQALVACTRKT